MRAVQPHRPGPAAPVRRPRARAPHRADRAATAATRSRSATSIRSARSTTSATSCARTGCSCEHGVRRRRLQRLQRSRRRGPRGRHATCSTKAGPPLELRVDPAFARPADVPFLVGDPSKLIAATGWQPDAHPRRHPHRHARRRPRRPHRVARGSRRRATSLVCRLSQIRHKRQTKKRTRSGPAAWGSGGAERVVDALLAGRERDVGERRRRRQLGRVGREAGEIDPRRAAAVRVVPRDRDRLVEPVRAQHEHPERVAPLPLEPGLDVVVATR